jgi:hypothetical protein
MWPSCGLTVASPALINDPYSNFLAERALKYGYSVYSKGKGKVVPLQARYRPGVAQIFPGS